MPSVDVEQNITKIQTSIEQLTQEIFRLQGSLRVFRDLKRSGLKVVEVPHEPRDEEEEEPQAEEPVEEVAESSTQE
jgi:hypothetical protein